MNPQPATLFPAEGTLQRFHKNVVKSACVPAFLGIFSHRRPGFHGKVERLRRFFSAEGGRNRKFFKINFLSAVRNIRPAGAGLFNFVSRHSPPQCGTISGPPAKVTRRGPLYRGHDIEDTLYKGRRAQPRIFLLHFSSPPEKNSLTTCNMHPRRL